MVYVSLPHHTVGEQGGWSGALCGACQGEGSGAGEEEGQEGEAVVDGGCGGDVGEVMWCSRCRGSALGGRGAVGGGGGGDVV